MNSAVFTDRVKALGLPVNQFIVIGSGVMGALGLRESGDIDLVVNSELFNYLESQGWRKEIRHNEEKVLLKDDVEAWLTWGNAKEPVFFEQLCIQSIIIDGIRFCSPEYVMQWKKAKARPKDIEDVKLLERYIRAHE